MIDIFIEDLNQKFTFNEGIALKDILKNLNGKFKDVVGGKLNGQIIDMYTPINQSRNLKFLKKEDKESLEILRHSLAHIMAQALKEIYGDENVHLGIGPTTEHGFYYDIEIEGKRLTDEDLPQIEEKMKEIIKKGYQIERFELPREEAIKFFENKRKFIR